MMATLTDWYEQKKIKPFIDSTMPMEQLIEAYERMNSRAVQGKLVMVNPA
jgi:NADPH2:quinone reductase